MKKKKLDDSIFDFEYLDEEERELIESIESSYEEWVPVPNLKEELAKAQQIARNTMRKSARVNVRMTQGDLRALKARAAAEAIPYQTILTALVHKYVSGQVKIL